MAKWERLQRLAKQFSPAEFGRVAVLYGGASAEREVSLKSGQAIIEALRGSGVDVLPVDTQAGLQTLTREKFDRAFIALHGRGGEDGSIQGALELLGVPYTGSGIMASALAMDKLKTKQIWSHSGIPTPEYTVLSAESDWQQELDRLQGKVMVKPAHEGSSIGMKIAATAAELEQAYHLASGYDQLVFAEQWVEGPEYTVAVLAGESLPVIGLKAADTFYDYDAKYISDATQYLLPSGLEDAQESLLQQLSMQASRALLCQGWSRVDIMMDEGGKPWLLEVNTVPGMTDHSLVPMAAKAAGLSFSDLVLAVLAQTMPSVNVGTGVEAGNAG